MAFLDGSTVNGLRTVDGPGAVDVNGRAVDLDRVRRRIGRSVDGSGAVDGSGGVDDDGSAGVIASTDPRDCDLLPVAAVFLGFDILEVLGTIGLGTMSSSTPTFPALR